MFILPAELQTTLAKFKEVEMILFRNWAYAKYQGWYQSRIFKKFGIPVVRTPESNLILSAYVIMETFVWVVTGLWDWNLKFINRNPFKKQ